MVDVIAYWNWKTFTIIYEDNDGIIRLQELLKTFGHTSNSITVRQLGDSEDYRPLLKQIKNSAEAHIGKRKINIHIT